MTAMALTERPPPSTTTMAQATIPQVCVCVYWLKSEGNATRLARMYGVSYVLRSLPKQPVLQPFWWYLALIAPRRLRSGLMAWKSITKEHTPTIRDSVVHYTKNIINGLHKC